MELIIYLFGYLLVLGAFISFGRFLKECDETMVDQLKNKPNL